MYIYILFGHFIEIITYIITTLVSFRLVSIKDFNFLAVFSIEKIKKLNIIVDDDMICTCLKK